MCFAVKAPRKNFFSDKHTAFLNFWTLPLFRKVSFRQQVNFWFTYVERHIIKVACMDHTDNFTFSENMRFDM